MSSIFLRIFVVAALIMSANASQNCVQVHGGVKCKKDPAKHANVEIRVYDRDGVSLFKLIDPDDLMG